MGLQSHNQGFSNRKRTRAKPPPKDCAHPAEDRLMQPELNAILCMACGNRRNWLPWDVWEARQARQAQSTTK